MAKYCIVQRKCGEIQSVWPLTEETGGDEKKADRFRVQYFVDTYGGDTGRRTTHVEEVEAVLKEDGTCQIFFESYPFGDTHID